MNDKIFSRAQILMQQNRFAEAKDELSSLLASDPNNPLVLGMYAEVMIALGEHNAAMETIDRAIGIAPDGAWLFYIKSRIFVLKGKYDDSEKMIQMAIDLDSSDADFFSLWASIKLARKKFQEALDLANQALDLDAENINALNTRSTALMKLNRKEESFSTIEGALQEDPNNAYTHANYGWSLLEKGDPKKALEHFKEALKNDPSLDMAKAGMMEALKAKYFVYKLFLQYAFFMGKLSAKYQWGIILGLYFLVKLLNMAARENPSLQPFIYPIIGLYSLFAISSWIITPISNLFLRLNPYGRHLLTREQTLSSNYVGISAGISIVGFLGYVATQNLGFLSLGISGLIMMMPFSVMFAPAKYKWAVKAYVWGLVFFGFVANFGAFAYGEIVNTFSLVFFVGIIAFQWIANFLLIRGDNR